MSEIYDIMARIQFATDTAPLERANTSLQRQQTNIKELINNFKNLRTEIAKQSNTITIKPRLDTSAINFNSLRLNGSSAVRQLQLPTIPPAQLGLLQQLSNKYKELMREQQQATNPARVRALATEINNTSRQIRNLTAPRQSLGQRLGSAFGSGALNQIAGGDAVGGLTSAISGFAGLSGPAGAAIGFIGTAIAGLGNKVFETRKKFETLEATLKNLYGSAAQADASFQVITDFVAKTPFQVDEVAGQFIKLSNTLGTLFDTDIEQKKLLTTIGDLASAFKKPFEQVSEAVIDAQRGQFVRLEEALGANVTRLAKGNKLKVDFRGQTYEIENNTKAILGLINQFGELQGIQGTMGAISETLEGKVSNLSDSFDRLFNVIGKDGDGAFKSTVDGLNSVVTSLADLIEYSDRLDFTTIIAKVGELGLKFASLTNPLVGLSSNGAEQALSDFAQKGIDSAKQQKQVENSITLIQEKSLKLVQGKTQKLQDQLRVVANVNTTEAQRTTALSIISKELGKNVTSYSQALGLINQQNSSLDKSVRLALLQKSIAENTVQVDQIRLTILNNIKEAQELITIIYSEDGKFSEQQVQVARARFKQLQTNNIELDKTRGILNATSKAQQVEVDKLKAQGVQASNLNDLEKKSTDLKKASNTEDKKGVDLQKQFNEELKRRRESLAKGYEDLLENIRKLKNEITLLNLGDNKFSDIAVETKINIDKEDAKLQFEKQIKELGQFKGKDFKGNDIVIDIRSADFKVKEAEYLKLLDEKYKVILETELKKAQDVRDKVVADLSRLNEETRLQLQIIDTENEVKAYDVMKDDFYQIDGKYYDRLYQLEVQLANQKQILAENSIKTELQGKITQYEQEFKEGKITQEQLDEFKLKAQDVANKKTLQSNFDLTENLYKANSNLINRQVALLDELYKSQEKNLADEQNKELISLNALLSSKQISIEDYEKKKAEIERKYRVKKINEELTALRQQLKLQQDELERANNDKLRKLTPEDRKKLEEQIRSTESQILQRQADLTSPENSTQKSSTDKIAGIRDKIVGVVDSLTQIFDVVGQLIQQQLNAIDQAIERQSTRVDKFKDKADQGNAEFYQREMERLEELQATKERIQERQEALQKAQIVANQAVSISNAIVAISSAAATGGPLAPFIIAANVASIVGGLIAVKSAFSQQGFAEGTPYLERGKNPKGRDTIPIWADEGERIIPTDLNLKYWDLLQQIQNDTPKAREMQQLLRNNKGLLAKTPNINPVDFKNVASRIIEIKTIERLGVSTKNLETRLDSIEQAIKSQSFPQTSVRIDERGIVAIQERYSKQLNKTRKL